MAFSDAFARGYAIGDAAKKRKATAKFFERFKELTADEDAEEVTSIGGIDVPASALPATETGSGESAVTPAAIPVTDSPAAAAATAAGAPPIPVADTAVPVSAPKRIALPGASKFQASLTQDHIKELDKLALEAARASGDIEVYSALQKTAESFTQGRVMKNLGLAQTALQNGDTDAAEKYLTKAYRYVPDGNEIKFKRKGDVLTINDPWDDKEVELTSDMVGNIATMIRDPEKWAEIYRQEKKDRAETKIKEREVGAREAGVEVDRQRNVLLGKQIGLDEKELALKGRQQELAELNARPARFAEYQRGIYYGALAEQAKRATTAGGSPGEFLSEANAISKTIEDSMTSLYEAPLDDFGKPVATWKPSPSIMVGSGPNQRPLDKAQMQEAMGFAQTIQMANLGAIGHQVAQQAGLQIVKAMADPENFNVTITGDSMTVPFQGLNVPIKLPPALVQAIAQRAQGGNAPEPTGAFWESGQYQE